MITTTCSSSRTGGRLSHLYRSILRRNLGFTAFYALLLFLFFPLQYLLAAARVSRMPALERAGAEITLFTGPGGIYTELSLEFFTILVLGAAAFFPLLQLSYLHDQRAADLFHMLPLRREKLLLTHFAASASCLLPPIWLCYILVGLAGCSYRFASFSPAGLWGDLFLVTAYTLAILAAATLTSTLTGTVFDNLVYLTGVLLAPPVVLYAVYLQTSLALFGFCRETITSRFLLTSPFTALVWAHLQNEVNDSYGLVQGRFLAAAAVWLALAAALTAAATLLYRRRGSELAGKTGRDNPLILCLKLLGALVGGMLFAELIAATAGTQSTPLRALLAAIGGAVLYAALESVLARGFKTLWRGRWRILLAMALPALLLSILDTGGLGFEARTPRLEDIQRISIENYQNRYGFARYDLPQMRALFEKASPGERRAILREEITLEDPQDFERILRMHTLIVRAHQREENTESIPAVRLRYQLKNGRTLCREYSALPAAALEEYRRLEESEAVKRQLHPVFTWQARDVRSITLMNRLMGNIQTHSLPEADLDRLLEALRADLLAESYEEMTGAEALGYLVLNPVRDGSFYSYSNLQALQTPLPQGETDFAECYVLLTSSYDRTRALLRELGLDGFEEADEAAPRCAYLWLNDYYDRRPMALTGPSAFQPERWQEDNQKEWIYAVSQEYTAFTDPQELRLLADLTQPYRPQARETFLLPPDDTPQTFTLEVVFFTGDESNLVRPLCIRPSDLPREMFERLRPAFEERWEGHPDREGLFDRLLEALDGPASALAGGTAAPAAASAAARQTLFFPLRVLSR